ncbi:MAG: phytoene desaturase family protein [Acidimicrobiales bacterium]
MVRSDVAIVGGGHNALVAATLLARAGRSVTVFERSREPGGAAVSGRPFRAVEARISRFAYLVSLFPRELMQMLGIHVELLQRSVGSCTPDGAGALVVSGDKAATRVSFERAGLGADHRAWVDWHARMRRVAEVIAPTLLAPLQPASYFEETLGPATWDMLAARPLGRSLRETFSSDLVRGVVLTDGLIGTFAHSTEESLRQNRCFLYHVIGDGTGDWKVPVGGMGALTDALVDAASAAGVDIRTDSEAVAVDADGTGATLATADGDRFDATVILCGAAPGVLDRLLGNRPQAASPAKAKPQGAQIKVNMLVHRLPRLLCGVDPEIAFSGTLHLNERHSQLDAAFHQARRRQLPDPLPCEVYCHSLTDASILGADLRARGVHTLSVFALHTPTELFEGDNSVSPDEGFEACMRSLQSVLADPIEDCLLSDGGGRPCVEVHTPLDVEKSLGMPGGNIFHGDLQWPWAETDEEVGTWGVQTGVPNVLLCGSGARRGGAVSGVGGHNAALAALELLTRQP